MVLALAQRPQPQSLNRTAVSFLPDVRELVAFCPGCKTLETLWFNNGRLTPTRKFNQQGEQVFHDCGTQKPCRLYRPC
jgi:hypothetical protein